MLRHLDIAALRDDLPGHGLKAGDRGTVVMIYDRGAAYEMEFIDAAGDTIAVLTLQAEQVQPILKPDAQRPAKVTQVKRQRFEPAITGSRASTTDRPKVAGE